MKARILVIEDEARWYDQFKDILISLDCEVEIASDFEQAQQLLKTSRYDLVLADACLNQFDFNIACQNFLYFLYTKYPTTPVVATTGKPLAPDEVWTLSQLGVVDFVYKRKLLLPEFRRCIQNALRRTSPPYPIKSSHQIHYDAFISYSHRNKQAVRDWLLPELEKAGVKVCIDFRDFDPGVPILAEMERAIAQSSKTLMLLTPDYLKGESTQFETILIQAIDPARRYHRVIPILLEFCELPLWLKALAYLDFTDPDQHAFQLSRLISAIQSSP